MPYDNGLFSFLSTKKINEPNQQPRNANSIINQGLLGRNPATQPQQNGLDNAENRLYDIGFASFGRPQQRQQQFQQPQISQEQLIALQQAQALQQLQAQQTAQQAAPQQAFQPSQKEANLLNKLTSQGKISPQDFPVIVQQWDANRNGEQKKYMAVDVTSNLVTFDNDYDKILDLADDIKEKTGVYPIVSKAPLS